MFKRVGQEYSIQVSKPIDGESARYAWITRVADGEVTGRRTVESDDDIRKLASNYGVPPESIEWDAGPPPARRPPRQSN